MSDQSNDRTDDVSSEPVTEKSTGLRGRFGRKAPKAEKVAKPQSPAAIAKAEAKAAAKAAKSSKSKKKGNAHPLRGLPLEMEDNGVIKIGRKTYAAEVLWRSFQGGGSLREAARVSTQDEEAEEYKIYIDGRSRNQVGFGNEDVGHKAGMPALVTAMQPEHTGESWLGCFPLDNVGPNWWLVGMREGQVYEDRVIKGNDEAISAFENDMDAPDWDNIFAPDEWNLPNTRNDPLTDLIDPKLAKKFAFVRPIKANLPKIIFLGMAVAIGVGVYYYTKSSAEQARIAAEELRRQNEAAIQVVPADYPWYENTDVSVFIDACTQFMSKSVVLMTGWETQPLVCTVERGAGFITGGVDRSEGGRIGWLRGTMPPGVSEPVLSNDGQTATFQRTFDAPIREDSLRAEPWDADTIRSTLIERFQNLGLPLVLNEITARSNVRADQQTKPIFNHFAGQIKTSVAMEEYADLISDVPALVPTSLIYSVATGEFSFDFKIYQPPIMPANVQ